MNSETLVLLYGLLIVVILVLLTLLYLKSKQNKNELQRHFSDSLSDQKLSLKNLESDSANRFTEVTHSIIETKESQKKLEQSLDYQLNSLVSQAVMIDSLRSDLTSELKGVEVDSRIFARELADENASNLNQRISGLVLIINQLVAENKELRKKIEFFTEIKSDSKELNDPGDHTQQEVLIKQAIDQLLAQPEARQPEDTERKTVAEKKAPEAATEESERKVELDDVQEKAVTVKTAVSTAEILDDEQKQAYTLMEYSKQNLFITGKAGTGKSFLLDIFSRISNKKVIKLAPTGRAAFNINGATLHSTFGFVNLETLHLDDIARSTIRLRQDKIRVLQEVETIVIDEVSMVRADILDKIDKILQALNNTGIIFGGKQIILFGDPFQLPPVAKSTERKFLIDRYGGVHFFQSDAYKHGDFKFIELSVNHRQKDDYLFFEILNRIRRGESSPDDISILNRKFVSNRDDLRRITTLFPTKAEADKVNRDELNKIEAKEYIYKAEILVNKKNDQTPLLENLFSFTNELKLKLGALVMFIVNSPDRSWVNGTLGIVSYLTESEIRVSIDGREYDVDPGLFTSNEVTYRNGRLEYEEVLAVKQYPLVLAYALTIHKSQGMTYKNIACDVESCFDTGQAYVALSRCSSLSGLHLLKPVTSAIEKVDSVVKDFYLINTGKE